MGAKCSNFYLINGIVKKDEEISWKHWNSWAVSFRGKQPSLSYSWLWHNSNLEISKKDYRSTVVRGTTWILCPICEGRTRVKVRDDTELKGVPLFCPKCKKKTVIDLKQGNITIIKEPDAKTKSRWSTVERLWSPALFRHKEQFCI
jgi:Zn-finger nucleic acid-binding protein